MFNSGFKLLILIYIVLYGLYYQENFLSVLKT